MCFLCQSLDPRTDAYDFHGLTGPIAAATTVDTSSAAADDKPVYTLEQVATQLTHGYWQSNGGDWRAFDMQAGGTLTVNIGALDAMGQATAMTALAAWTAMSGLQFMTTSGDADITFQDTESGAYAYSAVYTGWNEIAYSVVNVHTSWQDNPDYYLQTYIHEIGHALGLGHGGNYNGSADFDSQTHYANDSWQMSVMSYFGQWENPNVDASAAYLLTPQMADALAIQTLYGTPDNVHIGDSIYGDTTNLTAIGMDLARGFAVTVFDSSGIDLIDLGSRAYDQRLSLVDATWSDIDGYTGIFGIAQGAVIENAITGSGDDHVTGNAASNDIQTGEGADTIDPGAGDDTISGGGGNDAVLFSGASGGYDLTWDGTLRITDTNLADGDDGSDSLIGIETLNFADDTIGTIESDGMVTSVQLYTTGSSQAVETLDIDIANERAWDSIARSYSATGLLQSQTTAYDDGQVLQASYADGQLIQTLMTDAADIYGWASNKNIYDDTGALTSNTYTWDSGKIVETYYDSSGARSGSFVTDGGNTFLWETIAYSYDADGLLADLTNTFDNGTVQSVTYSGGQRSSFSVTDGGDTAPWSSYTDTYNDTGVRVLREMSYDDGRHVEIGYIDGVLASYVITDGADSFAWASIALTWDAGGVITSQTTAYDDGRILETAYTEGVRTSISATDGADTADWTHYTDTYDVATGARILHRMTYDDGREVMIDYADGKMVSQVLTDAAAAFDWTTITRSYDVDGQLTDLTTAFDNGNLQVITYNGGQQSAVSMTDGSETADWSSYTDSYDTATGDRTAREMIYDDGNRVVTGYSDGTVTSQTQYDGADSFDWASNARSWDSEGTLDGQTYVYDDGRVQTIDYADGIRSMSVTTDAEDAHDWSSVTETFDDTGALIEQITLFDDGTRDSVIF